jgi:hypothetical protein
MKTTKIGIAIIAGKVEAGMVIKENTTTCLIKFEKLPRSPILTMKKKRVKLILGDKWEK